MAKSSDDSFQVVKTRLDSKFVFFVDFSFLFSFYSRSFLCHSKIGFYLFYFFSWTIRVFGKAFTFSTFSWKFRLWHHCPNLMDIFCRGALFLLKFVYSLSISNVAMINFIFGCLKGVHPGIFFNLEILCMIEQ